MADSSTSTLEKRPITRQPIQGDNGGGFNKFGYLGIGLLANALIWILAITYLKVAPSTYESEWGVIVLGTDPGVDVTLPEGGRATRSQGADRARAFEDPRTDYVFLAESPDIIETAAEAVDLSVKKFGEPTITANEDSSIVGFSIEGKTPEQAQQKALALHGVLDQRVEQLRQAEIARRRLEGEADVENARAQVEEAQNALASYRGSSGLSSEAQIEDLAVGIEQLRREYSLALAQEQGLGSQVAQLADDINASSAGAADAYRLEGDPVYQQQFEDYGIVAAEFSELAAQLGDQHPLVVEKRAEVQGASSALESRGSFLLGRSVDQSTLTQLAPLSLDPRVEASRGNLFEEAVVGRATQSGLQSQTAELANQIAGLESRLRQFSQDQFTVDRLKRDLQVSEAVFASVVAKLNLNEDDIYSIYPPLQLAAEPTLPDEDDNVSPSPIVAFGGGLAGSFLVTTGLLLHWANRRKPEDKFEPANFPFRA